MLFSFLASIGAAIQARVAYGLAYGPEGRHRLDVYAPVGADGETPVVVFTHSALPSFPSRRHFAAVGQMLAARGLVTIIPDFRVGPQSGHHAFLRDVAQACAWAQTHAGQFGADPARLFLVGHSGGAHIAALLALEARWLEGAGLGPADVRGVVGVSGRYHVRSADAAPASCGSGEGTPVMQPIIHAAAGAPPMLLIAGARDELDPDRNTGALAGALRLAGGRVTEIRYPRLSDRRGLNSLAGWLRFRTTALDEVERFIRLHSLELAV